MVTKTVLLPMSFNQNVFLYELYFFGRTIPLRYTSAKPLSDLITNVDIRFLWWSQTTAAYSAHMSTTA